MLFLVNVDIKRVKEDWLEADGQFQIRSIAQHYGIYEHLFGYAFFLPRVNLDIKVILKLLQTKFTCINHSNNYLELLFFLIVCNF